MSSSGIGKFINRNLVAIIIVPTIVGLHLVCDSIMNNEKFVKKEDQRELPIVVAARKTREEVLAALRGNATQEEKEQ